MAEDMTAKLCKDLSYWENRFKQITPISPFDIKAQAAFFENGEDKKLKEDLGLFSQAATEEDIIKFVMSLTKNAYKISRDDKKNCEKQLYVMLNRYSYRIGALRIAQQHLFEDCEGFAIEPKKIKAHLDKAQQRLDMLVTVHNEMKHNCQKGAN